MRLDTGFVLNQRYRIVSLLGRGGMGALYRAWDINLGIPVAIDSWHTTGWGWEQPGNWSVGIYRVDLYIEDQLIVEDFFEIYQ